MGMNGDSGIRPPATPPAGDPWALPDILAVEISRVRYVHPRVHVARGKIEEVTEAVEILVRTSGPIPVRALSPALHIGDIQIAENVQEAPDSYRFLLFGRERPCPGAPIALGWVGQPPRPTASEFRYELPSGIVERDPYEGKSRGDLAPEHLERKEVSDRLRRALLQFLRVRP